MISFYSCYTVRSIIIINIIVIAVVVIIIIYYCYRIIVISCPHCTCCLTGQYHSVGTVGCTLWLALSKQIKIPFFVTTTLISPHPHPLSPPLHTEIVVQFYPWSKFYFLLFQTHYHTLPYPKTYLPWHEPTSVVLETLCF